MKILKFEPTIFAAEAAKLIAQQMQRTPDGLISFATGKTTTPVHASLAKLVKAEWIDVSRLSVFNVDEYFGIERTNPKTCIARMNSQLYEHIGVGKKIFIDPEARDYENECSRVAAEIAAAGGIDLQILGIGTDGHIGFNDPGAPWECEMFVNTFSEQSLGFKSDFFGSNIPGGTPVPRCGATLGVKGIMHSRNIMLLASGASKREIIKKTLEGRITPEVPSTALQLHPFVTVAVDFDL